jgi:hypothetical protein
VQLVAGRTAKLCARRPQGIGAGGLFKLPEVTVRKRVGRRSGSWRYRLSRWSYRYRPQIAVGVAFGLMVVVAVGITAALQASAVSEDSEQPNLVLVPGS